MLQQERAKPLGWTSRSPEQFVDWIGVLIPFDFGLSMWTGRLIIQEIAVRLEPRSARDDGEDHRGAVALPLGTPAALMRGTWIDYTRIITIGGLSMPGFWFGI